MNEATLRAILTGQDTRRRARLVRGLLRPLGTAYGAVMRLRNLAYDRGWLPSVRMDVPVFCVGNLTTGGTGKTPLVAWLCRELKRLCPDRSGAVLTRGYRTGHDGRDEPALLAQAEPAVAVVVDPDRVAGGRRGVQRFDAAWLVMDDGFQHRRLHRDLDLLAVDATCPFGGGRVLPAGLLREPITGLRRAQAVVLTRCDQVPAGQLADLEETLRRIHPGMLVARAVHRPCRLVDLEGRSEDPATLRGRRVLAFCGLGNPEAFYRTLRDLGAELVHCRSFPDHHRCTESDLRHLADLAVAGRAEWILTTQKNALGLPVQARRLSVPLRWLEVTLEIEQGNEPLRRLIRHTLDGTIARLNRRQDDATDDVHD